LRNVGDPFELALRYNDQGADEMVFFDINSQCPWPGDDGERDRADGPTNASCR